MAKVNVGDTVKIVGTDKLYAPKVLIGEVGVVKSVDCDGDYFVQVNDGAYNDTWWFKDAELEALPKDVFVVLEDNAVVFSESFAFETAQEFKTVEEAKDAIKGLGSSSSIYSIYKKVEAVRIASTLEVV